MGGSEKFPQPIEVVFNYWEFPVSKIGERLDEILRQGIDRLTSFIPWQGAESDISHSLPRFLVAATERRMKIRLIATPEVGVHFWNSGLPKDLISKAEVMAKDSEGKPIYNVAPPNAFAIPSLYSSDFSKRYFQFLSRLDGLLADVERISSDVKKSVQVSIGGSFWKYYRSPKLATLAAFSGLNGDASSSAAVAYRQRIDHLYAGDEFNEEGLQSSRWKTRKMEESNRKWFHQQSEEVFRSRSQHSLGRKVSGFQITQVEVFTPEVDPALTYSNIFAAMGGTKPDFFRLASYLNEISMHTSSLGAESIAPWIHWTDFVSFHALTEPEKQFLLIKSLLVAGVRRGGMMIDLSEWLKFSPAFRSRVENLARMLEQDSLRVSSRIFCLISHQWSEVDSLCDEVVSRLGVRSQFITHLDSVAEFPRESTLLVDSSVIIAADMIERLLYLAQAGHRVVIQKGGLLSTSARAVLENAIKASSVMNFTVPQLKDGTSQPIQIRSLGAGQIVLYDMQAQRETVDVQKFIEGFAEMIIKMGSHTPHYGVSDSRLETLILEKSNGSLAFFVLNPSHTQLDAEIMFNGDVFVSDLTSDLNSSERVDRLALTMKPWSIVPLTVKGMGLEAEERKVAQRSSEVLKATAQQSAESELPGLGEADVWN